MGREKDGNEGGRKEVKEKGRKECGITKIEREKDRVKSKK